MPPLDTEKLRVALFGGSFDPVHNGHLMIARYALKQIGLDRVIFVPAAKSPLKQGRAYASDNARMEMLELATSGEPRFKVDSVELEKGGISYTVDTVEYFRAQMKKSELFFLIGADQFELLDRWYKIEKLMEMVTFLVFGRPGTSLDGRGLKGLHYVEVDAPLMEVSSSEIRALVGTGQALTDLVCPPVEAFISEEGLYTDG
ncbi:MAG: nicotinate (nicotinamide) nucleotide adenylyltransferase [Lentimonas sp.]